jgi:NUMOD4 motif
MSEIWKPVVGFEGLYEVSNLGRVRSLDRISYRRNRWGPMACRVRGRVLKQSSTENGYLQVSLHGKYGQVSRRVAHIVAAAFIGPRPCNQVVCHNDGDKRNNYASNIRYDTGAGNERDKQDHGTSLLGEKHFNAKLDETAVLRIRRSALSSRALAKIYNVSHSTIGSVVRYETWRHV